MLNSDIIDSGFRPRKAFVLGNSVSYRLEALRHIDYPRSPVTLFDVCLDDGDSNKHAIQESDGAHLLSIELSINNRVYDIWLFR